MIALVERTQDEGCAEQHPCPENEIERYDQEADLNRASRMAGPLLERSHGTGSSNSGRSDLRKVYGDHRPMPARSGSDRPGRLQGTFR